MFVQKLAIILITTILSWQPQAYSHTYNLKQAKQEMNKVIIQREEAVNRKNWEQFKRTLIPNDTLYQQEQKRWFADAITYIDPQSFTLKIDKVIAKNKDTVLVWLEQKFRKNKKQYVVRYPLLFRHVKEGWRDQDFPFNRLQKDKIKVLYTDPLLEEKAHVALDMMKRTSYVMQQRYHWKPKHLTLKLYHQPDWFQQSVKLSLPAWAGGWNEANQSIKLISGMQTIRSFSSGIVHEMVHQLISDQSHDNAAYWLQEGAAMYYEEKLLPGLHEDIPEQKSFRPFTLAQLEKKDLEQLNAHDAQRYYLSCYHFFDFLYETYGERKIQQVLHFLQRFPQIDADSSDKIPELNRRTQLSLRHVLGKTVQIFDREWIRYQIKEKNENSLIPFH